MILSVPQQPTEYSRNITFPTPAFHRLKKFQRQHEERHGVELTNSEALAAILEEHEQFASIVALLPEPLRHPLALRCEEALIGYRARAIRASASAAK